MNTPGHRLRASHRSRNAKAELTAAAAPRATGRGFTLLEIVISTVIVAILMLGLSSVMLLVTRCLNSTGIDVCESADVIDYVTTDLALAESFSQRTATSVTMVVPDRDGDAQAETIKYSWSGVAGDPLMRTYNAGSETVVAENVHYFDLTYITKSVGGG